MARHVADKTTPADLDDVDRDLLTELRGLREDITKGVEAKEERGPEVIARLRARGVDPEMIADAFGVGKSRIYQIPPADTVDA